MQNNGDSGQKRVQGTDTKVSNSNKELLSPWRTRREMVSSDVIKQGQWRVVYIRTGMESVTALLMASWLRAERGGDPGRQD